LQVAEGRGKRLCRANPRKEKSPAHYKGVEEGAAGRRKNKKQLSSAEGLTEEAASSLVPHITLTIPQAGAVAQPGTIILRYHRTTSVFTVTELDPHRPITWKDTVKILTDASKASLADQLDRNT